MTLTRDFIELTSEIKGTIPQSGAYTYATHRGRVLEKLYAETYSPAGEYIMI